MSMTLITTRNVPDRHRGFLASCMLEVVPGTYIAPRLNQGVRERIWNVMLEWAPLLPTDAGILMIWRQINVASGIGINTIGWPRIDLVEVDSLWLARHDLTQSDLGRLATDLVDGDELPLLPENDSH